MTGTAVHDEIKSYIAKQGYTLTKVVAQMNDGRPTEEHTTVQNISNKLARGTLKYSEAAEIAKILGLTIVWT